MEMNNRMSAVTINEVWYGFAGNYQTKPNNPLFSTHFFLEALKRSHFSIVRRHRVDDADSCRIDVARHSNWIS
jgi:hypothetical protein